MGVSGTAPWLRVPISVDKHRRPRGDAVCEVLVAFWSRSRASSAGRRKSRVMDGPSPARRPRGSGTGRLGDLGDLAGTIRLCRAPQLLLR